MTTKLGAGEAVPAIPGAQHRNSASYQVSNLSSLFTVCALALNDTEEWSEDYRKRATEEIKLVLELGAYLAVEACVLVERLEVK